MAKGIATANVTDFDTDFETEDLFDLDGPADLDEDDVDLDGDFEAWMKDMLS